MIAPNSALQNDKPAEEFIVDGHVHAEESDNVRAFSDRASISLA